jgi:hypothetical protein
MDTGEKRHDLLAMSKERLIDHVPGVRGQVIIEYMM